MQNKDVSARTKTSLNKDIERPKQVLKHVNEVVGARTKDVIEQIESDEQVVEHDARVYKLEIRT